MFKNEFKNARISLYMLAFLLLFVILFYFFASMFTSMGYRAFSEAQNTLNSSKKCSEKILVIDAGHGGEDPGAVSDNIKEKDINLKIAKILNDISVSNGLKTAMTRTEDVLLYNAGEEKRKKYYDIHNRLTTAESYGKNSVFISIHLNKYPVEKYFGLQTFYSDNSEKSILLAELIQKNARIFVPENTRKIKNGRGTSLILEKLETPAVLIECGFLSNKKEAENLQNDIYQKQLALSIYCGICEYLEEENNEN